MKNDYWKKWNATYRDELLENVMPFWMKHGWDRKNGGVYTCLDRDGSLMDSTKSVWFQGRFGWVTAYAYNHVRKDKNWLAASKSCCEFLEAHCFDPKDGRAYFEVTAEGVGLRKRRYVFSECFAAIAYAEYSLASGDKAWAKKSVDLFKRIRKFVANPKKYMPSKYEPTLEAQGHSLTMILINVANVLKQVSDDPVLDRQITESVEMLVKYFIHPEFKALLETVGPKGEFIDTIAGRVINPGHCIETAWFLMDVAQARQDEALKEIALQILDWSWDWGWDKKYGGITSFKDCRNLPAQCYEQDMKFWWPQCETIIASAYAYRLTGKAKYLKMHKLVSDWAWKHLKDKKYPEWYGYLHYDGTVAQPAKGNIFKGPFHIPRMLIRMIGLSEACEKVSKAAVRAAFAFVLATGALFASASESVIWDDRPAGARWENSWYPLGNGRLGCMVDGGAKTLKVQFNVDSFWTGDKNITGPVNDGNADRNYRSMGAYQNFGELAVGFEGIDGEVTDYRRELDVATAVYSDRFRVGGRGFWRRIFASAPDDCIVIAIRSDKALTTPVLKLNGTHGETSTSIPFGPAVSISGTLPNGMDYVAGADPFLDSSEQVVIVLRAVTGSSKLKKAAKPDVNAMYRRHVAEYRGYYDRFVLDLGEGDATVPTRERLARVKKGGSDPALTALQFNFGRYLLIGSSRPGTLPANLQGIWNNSNNPAWHGDYHTNINIQMNYWGADSANLSECFLPFSDWMMAALPTATAVTRATFPDSKGYAYQTSANHVGGGGWRWNFAGAPWMAAQCYDHYLFTRDRKYLRETAWPLMKGAAEFLISEELKERPDGTVVVKNGWSPEHGPREDGVTHDQQITRELFRAILAAAKELKIDDEFTKKVASLEPRLLKDKIGSWGQVQEWETDRDQKGDQHRHTSHLYAVYPGSTINRSTPELFAAAKVSLDGRALTGDSHRSWTWPWRAALWARLGEPDKAGAMLELLLRHNTLDNLFATHPPFQIDGNLGMIAAVCEILLESEGGKRLPQSWPHGSVKGLKTRTGKVLEFAW